GSTLGGTTTVAVDPTNHTATFSGLTLNNAGNGYTLTVSADGVTSPTAAFNVTTNGGGGGGGGRGGGGGGRPGTAPTIIAAQLTTYRKLNKKHRPTGKPLAEVLLTFSAPMNTGTIDNAGNYQVAWESLKTVRTRVKVGKRVKTVASKVPVFHPVPI